MVKNSYIFLVIYSSINIVYLSKVKIVIYYYMLYVIYLSIIIAFLSKVKIAYCASLRESYEHKHV